MPMFLVPLEEGDPVPLDKAVLFVGRHPDCDLVLTNSRKVSRKHCCIAQINDGFVVRDLGSLNGLRINDQTVKDELRFRPGDELWVGDIGFRLEFRATGAPKASEDPTQPDSGSTAGGKNVFRKAGLDKKFISQDMPVAIPEEGADLIVEKTNMRLRRPDDSAVIELNDD
jgi:pSer/pThr/pTyr-binding forkhead associated (FHA) protein